MKKIFLIFFLFISDFGFGQDGNKGIDTAFTRHKISLELGSHYSIITGSGPRFIEPRIIGPSSPSIHLNQYAGFTVMPAHGIQFGGLYDCFLNKNWGVRTGLLYFNRRSIFESDSATLAIYNDNLLTVKYDISPNNIDIPLFLIFKYKKLNVLLGTKINIATYKVTKTEDVFGEKQKSTEGLRYTNPFRNFFGMCYPSLRLSYAINFKGYDLSFYTAIDMRGKRYYESQLGVEIPLFKK